MASAPPFRRKRKASFMGAMLRAALLSDGPVLELPTFDSACTAPRAPTADGPGSGATSPAAILEALDKARWKVTGPSGAAAALGMHPNTLRYRMQRLGIRRPAS